MILEAPDMAIGEAQMALADTIYVLAQDQGILAATPKAGFTLIVTLLATIYMVLKNYAHLVQDEF